MSEQDTDIESEVTVEPATDADRGSGGVGGFLVGMVIGAVVGASIAVLATPQRGRVMRQQIKRRLEEIGDDARDRADGWREQASRRLSRRRQRRRRRGAND